MHKRYLDNTVLSGNVKSMPLSLVACELFYSLSYSVFSVSNYVIFFSFREIPSAGGSEMSTVIKNVIFKGILQSIHMVNGFLPSELSAC